MTQDLLSEIKTDPELLALLERAKQLPPPSPIERLEQKRSWVRGEMLFDGKLTESEVDALLLKIPEFALLAEHRRLSSALERMREQMEKIADKATYQGIHVRGLALDEIYTLARAALEGASE